MTRYLITGAAGFIGSHLCDNLLATGAEVVGVDNFNNFYDPNIKRRNIAIALTNKNFTLVEGSILTPTVIGYMFIKPVDVVIHLAAWAGVRPSIEQPVLYQRENVEATTLILDAVRAHENKPRVVLASSSSVYGNNKKVPFSEDDQVDFPISPYAATKKCCELIAHSYAHIYGLDVACLRFFTVYGPRQRPEMAIHKFAKLLTAGKPVPQYGNGGTIRDYTYIDDIIDGIVRAADRSRGYQVYNLGNYQTVRLDELIGKLAVALGVMPDIERLPEQPGDVEITYADITKARDQLGYNPKTSIDEGLKRFAEWFRNNQ